MKSKFVIIVFFVIFVSGCGGSGARYISEVSSFGDSYKKSYVLLPGKDAVNKLEFNEYAKYLHRALETNGFRRAINGLNNAEIAVFVEYGVSDKYTEYEMVSVRSAPRVQSIDYSRIPRGGVAAAVMRESGERIGGAFRTKTMRVPFDVYKRSLRIFAVAINNNKLPSSEDTVLWETTITSSGSSGDLRKVMPYMVTASEDYIGKSTGNAIEVEVGSKNKRAKRIKGELKVERVNEEKGVLDSILDIF